MTKHLVLFLTLVLLSIFFFLPSYLVNKEIERKKQTLHPALIEILKLIPREHLEKMVNKKSKAQAFVYFENHDLNYQYYIEDFIDVNTVVLKPSGEPFYLIVDSLLENPGIAQYLIGSKIEKKKSRFRLKGRLPHFWVHFIPPVSQPVDYNRLRIAIFGTKENFKSPFNRLVPKLSSEIYDADEVDSLPKPLRGESYFEKQLLSELSKQDIFRLYDLDGEITVRFTIGHGIQSPNIVRGFGELDDKFESWKADGTFIKVLNSLKVHWSPGYKDGKPVKTEITRTFKVSGSDISVVLK